MGVACRVGDQEASVGVAQAAAVVSVHHPAHLARLSVRDRGVPLNTAWASREAAFLHRGRQYARWYRANRDRIIWERRKAAVNIQRTIRGRLGRKKFAAAKAHHELVIHWTIRVQAVYRKSRVPHWRKNKLSVVQRVLETRGVAERKRAAEVHRCVAR